MRARIKMVTAEMETSKKKKKKVESHYMKHQQSPTLKGNQLRTGGQTDCMEALTMLITVHMSLSVSSDRGVYK